MCDLKLSDTESLCTSRFRTLYSRVLLQHTPREVRKRYIVMIVRLFGPRIFHYVKSGPEKKYVITVDTL